MQHDLPWLGRPHPHVQGAPCERIVVRADQAITLPATVDLRRAAVVEPLSVALHAVATLGNVFDRTVLVTVAGPIGSLAVAVLTAAGAWRVYVSDLFDHALGIAKQCNANVALPTAELSLMRPNAHLIDVARGPVVEQRSLSEALQEGRIAGAGLDVWYQDPPGPGRLGLPAELPFEELANVVLTPHYSGVTDETFHRRASAVAANINRLARGEALANRLR